jgi:protein TonB
VSVPRLPLGLSVAGHALGLAALLLYVAAPPPMPQPATGGIELVFAPPPPPEPPPAAAPETPPEPEPPPPEPEPPPKVVEAPPPPPPQHKPVVRPKPVARHIETPPSPTVAAIPPMSEPPPQSAPAATPVPAPVPSAEVSPGYTAALHAWLDGHKRYPADARQRGEEGRAVLRFEVDRSGRVLGYKILQSSGHAELDAAVEEMMHGATLPPFPAGMTQPSITVSVTIRFSLSS